MATGRLTWQNVAAPDFSGAVAAQRASALAFDSAMERLGGAVETFDNNRKDRADAALMRNALQYQNADELQAAIASGALMQGVNPDHVRVEALLKAQGQAGNLLKLDQERQKLATDKQSFDFNAQSAPLILQQAQHNLDKGEYTFGRTQESDARSDEERLANEGAQREFAALQQGGKFQTVADIATWGRGQDLSTPQGRAAFRIAQSQAPDAFKLMDPVTLLPGAAGATAGALSSIGGPSTSDYMGANGKPLSGTAATFARALHGQESSFGAADTSKINEHGVTGPMQVQDKTFEGMKTTGLIPKDWSHTNPKHNMDAGTIWSEHLLNKHGGDIARAAAEYYSGPAAVNADGTINRDRRDLKNPKAPTVGEYVDQVLQRAAALPGQSVGGATPTAPVTAAALAPTAAATADIPSRTELAVHGGQAAMAIGQSANRANATTGRLLLEAQNKSLTGSANVQLQPVVNRLTGEGGQFAGMPRQHVEKMLREVGQQIGSGDNYEVPAVLLAGMGTVEKTAGIRRYIPGADDPGRYFDTAQVQETVEQFMANGGTKAYTDLAAADIATSLTNSQASNVASMDTLRTQLANLKTLAARGNQAAAAQVPLVEAALSATMLSSNAESLSLAQRLGPTPTVPTPSSASTAPAPTTAPAPAPAPASYRDFVDNSPAAARERRAAAQAEKDARDAEARQQEVKRKGEVMQQVARVSPDSIRRMTPHEARSMMGNSEVFNRLPRASQRMLERQASL